MQVGEGQGWQCLTGSEVANACWGLATARHCTPALGHMMHAGLQPEVVANMKARQVTALLWGCAVLLHQPAAVLTNLASTVESSSGAAYPPGRPLHVQLPASLAIICWLSLL